MDGAIAPIGQVAGAIRAATNASRWAAYSPARNSSMKTYLSNRFYLRGRTWLGLLNTILACLINRVLVRHVDTETRKTVRWSIRRGTDFPKVHHDL